MSLFVLILANDPVSANSKPEVIILQIDRPFIPNNLQLSGTRVILHPGVPYRNGIFTTLDVYPRDPARQKQLFAEHGAISYVQPIWINAEGRVVFRGSPIHNPAPFNEPRYLDNPEPLHIPRCFPIPLVRSPYDETCPLVLVFPHELFCLDSYLQVTQKQKLPLQVLDAAIIDEQVLLVGLGPKKNLLHRWDTEKKDILESQLPADLLIETLTRLKNNHETFADLNLTPLNDLLQRPRERVKEQLERITQWYHRQLERTSEDQIESVRTMMKYRRLRTLHPAFLQMKVMTHDHRIFLGLVYPVAVMEWDWEANQMKSFVPAETLPMMQAIKKGNLHPIHFSMYRGQPTLWVLFTYPLTLDELKTLDPELAQRMLKENPNLSGSENVSFDTNIWGLGFSSDKVEAVYWISNTLPAGTLSETIPIDGLFTFKNQIYRVFRNKKTKLHGYYILHD